MSTIYLKPSDVPQNLRGAYTGKQFKAEISDTGFVPADAGTWGGGSRDTYRYIELATGRSVPISDASSAPWDASRRDNTFPLRPGFAVVMHSMFCGKDHGLTFTVHPNDATKMLPSGNELTEHEKTVLTATKSYKASYAGMDRYQMAQSEDYRFAKPFPTRPEWQLAKESLITKKLLNKAGAITIDGRASIQSRQPHEHLAPIQMPRLKPLRTPNLDFQMVL